MAARVTRYTHPEASPKRLDEARASLARLAAHPDIRASLADEAAARPRRVCRTCKGNGVATWTGPHAGSCPECRGFRHVEMTVDEIRIAYRIVRNDACTILTTTRAAFDALVMSWIDGSDEPGRWLTAARMVLARACMMNGRTT